MGKCMTELVNKLSVSNNLSDEEFTELLKFRNKETTEYLYEKAMLAKEKYYGKKYYIRGVIELTNNCKNNCYYCGLRRENIFIPRYRLDEYELMDFCSYGYDRGIRSFMLVGGDDYNFTEERVADMIAMIKENYDDCAVGLAMGQRSHSTYQKWFDAGADRYVLCHETADDNHFKKLHPSEMSLLTRKQSLWELKEIGYQVGSGFMIGMPHQMIKEVVEDIKFLKTLDPQIIQVVPFVPSAHTRFENDRSGNGDMTLYIMAILRLMQPRAMITADITLNCVRADGVTKAFQAGANEACASLTTDEIREYYHVYVNRRTKKHIAGDQIDKLEKGILECGGTVGSDRGDYVYPAKSEKLYGKIHRIMRL